MYQAIFTDGPLAHRSASTPVLTPQITATVGSLSYTYLRLGSTCQYRVDAGAQPTRRKTVLPDVRPPVTRGALRAKQRRR